VIRRPLHCRGAFLALGLWLLAALPAAAAELTLSRLQAEPEAWPAGTWEGWKKAFLTAEGRVVDNANGNISHSEGQGYGLLLAVAANDRAAFDRQYRWAQANLKVRGDQLFAWKWVPDQTPPVPDRNNASDGDLLIAWALVEAAERWNHPPYRADAAAITRDLDRLAGTRSSIGRIMLPGVHGFSVADREKEEDGPVVNPSYWVFPALDRLTAAAPKVDWAGYRASGYTLARLARFGPAELPTEWVSLKNRAPAPAQGFPQLFSYNAVRIPLYLTMGKLDPKPYLAPFVAHYVRNGGRLYEYDTEKKANAAEMADDGYRAVLALAKCAFDGEQIPVGLRSVSFDRYYSATLHMLALAAARLRSDKCL
jgi:endoglucanase